jgi:O-antigen/teichoic acid export membrane protein
MLKKNSISLNAFNDLTLGFLFKLIGFFGVIYLSRKFGTTSETDQIYYVLTFILAITGIFQVVNSAIIFPLLSNSLEKKNQKDSLNLSLNLSIYALIFILIFSFIFIFFSDSLIIYFSKFMKPIEMPLSLKIAYILVVFFVFLFDSLMNISRGLGNFYHHNVSQIFGALFSFFSIIYLSDFFGPKIIIYSYLISYAIQTLFLFFIFYKHKIFDGFQAKNLFNSKYLHLTELLPPYIYQQFFSFFVAVLPNYLISSFAEGNLSSVYYARKFFDLALSFLVLPIVGAISPLLSSKNISKSIFSSLDFMNYLLIPISIYVLYFGDFFASILFKNSINFEQRDLFVTSLKVFFISLSSLAFISLITRTLVMNQSYKFAYVNLYQSAISSLGMLVCIYFSVKFFGAYGMSLGHTFFLVIFGEIVCFAIWKWYFGYVGFMRNILSNALPILFSFFSGLIAYMLIEYFFVDLIIKFLMSLFLYCALYMLLCFYFKTDFFRIITSKGMLLLNLRL